MWVLAFWEFLNFIKIAMAVVYFYRPFRLSVFIIITANTLRCTRNWVLAFWWALKMEKLTLCRWLICLLLAWNLVVRDGEGLPNFCL